MPDTQAAPEEAAVDKASWRKYNVVSAFVIPLSTGGGRPLGFWGIDSTTDKREWPERLQKRLRIIAEVFANTIERAVSERQLLASETRLTLAAETAGAGFWTIDVETSVIWATPKLKELFGLKPDDAFDTTALLAIVHPEDRESMQQAIDAMTRGEERRVEYRILPSSGKMRWVLSRGSRQVFAADGRSLLMGITFDITERKRQEEALKKSEEKFSKAFRRSPMGLTLTSANDHRYLDVNESFERMTGWYRDEVIGRTPLDLSIWVNASDRLDFVKQLLAHEVVREIEVHFRRKDGSERVGLGSAELIEVDDETCVLSVVADITERKLAERALADVTRKLIESQEQERARIGRELHDDINQRLAMLSVEVEQLRGNPSEIETRVQELRKQIDEISTDVQGLSHDLHSSKLEYLGAVAGMKSWCKEFAERHKLVIDFISAVPSRIPLEIGVSLFRVLQEALQNAITHSGAKRFEVQLRKTPVRFTSLLAIRAGVSMLRQRYRAEVWVSPACANGSGW